MVFANLFHAIQFSAVFFLNSYDSGSLLLPSMFLISLSHLVYSPSSLLFYCFEGWVARRS